MMELERQVREAIENVVYQRKTAVKELEPLAKEVISQQYSVDRIEFEKEEQPDQGLTRKHKAMSFLFANMWGND